ncbi:putative membrane protein [Wickerhamomyces ciferrii]|uniref:Membrane protein n=1 Tax=Wickerhamomyces ciferrii (strain ATCC 14091 / BCRC 22168 / CBS 111 / JCM 3599 / NBRC 0793 / NRRL Y-1031 F-60-10) TaxID=1206466 RepID=K0KBG3_WICCF|nr:uncharacterized protein BN7_1905 [Wickerhamomyces ciferrii]CCH42360.1 putative membrane protein [Wickerhamomyces ciferrii]
MDEKIDEQHAEVAHQTSKPRSNSLFQPNYQNSTTSTPDLNSEKSNGQPGQQGQDEISSDNILSQYDEDQVMQMGKNFALKHNLPNPEMFAKGAAIARNPKGYNRMSFLTDEEKQVLHQEVHNPWKIPKKLYQVIFSISLAAATQGADETVISGALLFYPHALGIGEKTDRNRWLEGLVNSAPYLFCAFVATLFTDPANKRFGRKKVIFWSCLASALTCFWQGFVNTWYHLFIARACLGAFGIGPKSATVPVYASETAPAPIRGALAMLWQFFTAFGIALGYVFSIAFYYVPNHGFKSGLNWRIMLGSAMIPAFLALFQIPFIPESPRWLMGKERYLDAFESLKSIRNHEVCAARDCFYQYVLLKEEAGLETPTMVKLREMFTVRRNRNALIAAFIVTFMQQFNGINIIAYYASTIFVEANYSQISALGVCVGYGFINTLFAIPAFFTIDKAGRRFLLLITFPFMSAFLFLTAFSFLIPTDQKSGRVGAITLGLYLFTCFYSFGSGVVTFPYTSECFPLYIRTLGSSLLVGNLWFWNFVIAITWPSMIDSFTPTGGFCFYAAWNIVGFFLVLWFLPETKGLTLEELDEIFDVPMYKHATYQTREFWHDFQRNFLRRNIPKQEPLYSHQRMAVTNEFWNDKPENQHIE